MKIKNRQIKKQFNKLLRAQFEKSSMGWMHKSLVSEETTSRYFNFFVSKGVFINNQDYFRIPVIGTIYVDLDKIASEFVLVKDIINEEGKVETVKCN